MIAGEVSCECDLEALRFSRVVDERGPEADQALRTGTAHTRINKSIRSAV